ncbi:glycosyl transferase [Roseivirga sp.]|uniref:glycosyl transferase n=1 Tax=Roseivirga sp. TaxID=1964215 RepID=UPI002B269A5B|nr:glycosyl transferase [Roseivirga sp.]
MTDSVNKKVLIITYYWPPSAGGGVQRWLKFSKYLPEYGWEPVIFTPENPDFDLKDDSLVRDTSLQTEVLKFPIWEPYSIFKKLSGRKELKQGQVLEGGKKSIMSRLAIWLRGNVFIPDPKIFWAKPSANYIDSILEGNNIKTIITTGPPHSMHLIGLKLKMKNPGVTWIADFRDPWSKWDILQKFNMSALVWRKHRDLEQKVIRAADCVLTVSNSWKSDFEKLGARRVKAITNGFDEEDFNSPISTPQPDKFRVSHVGMLNVFRNPEWFWKVLNEMVTSGELGDDLEIEFVGILSDDVLATFKSHTHLMPLIRKYNYLPHSEVLGKYQQSSVLLLLQNNSENAKGHLPGKLFEYLGAQRRILCVGNKESDLAEILNHTKSGSVFEQTDENQLKSFLREAYQDWKNGNSITNVEGISRFGRRSLTQELSELLNTLGTR